MKRVITFALAFEPFEEYKKLYAVLDKSNVTRLSNDTYILNESDIPAQLTVARLEAALFKDDTFYYISVSKEHKLLVVPHHGLRNR